MQPLLSGTILARDLVSADRRLIAPRGHLVDGEFLKEVAARAPRGLPEVPLFETPIGASVLQAFDHRVLEHVIRGESDRAVATDVLAEVRFPQPVWDELQALRNDDGRRYQHAVSTAVIAARLSAMALGTRTGLGRLVGGALTHDLGMRHTPVRLRFRRGHLVPVEAQALKDHTILGALLLASVLGDAPAVRFALLHHDPAGFAYGRSDRPLRDIDLVSAASAFAAMIAPRSYREAFSARGAVDQLVADAMAGRFDLRAIRVLIRCLRGAEPKAPLQFPSKPTGLRPTVNHHGVSAA